MSVEKYQRQYGRLVIPDIYKRREYDRVIEVTPLSDQWLLSMERTWDEIDFAIEGRLRGVQMSFIDPKKFPQLAASYGIEKPVSENVARFMAYVELVDEYRLGRERFELLARERRGEYEIRKQQINQGPGGRGRKEHLITTLWKSTYNAQIQNCLEQASEKKRVQDLVLRKAVMDVFSFANGQSLAETDLVKVITEAEDKLARNSDEKYEELKLRDPIGYFLDTLSNYLVHTNEGVLFNKYNYKSADKLVRTTGDIRVLDTCLTLALDSDSLGVSPPLRTRLERLGRSYFAFLKRRAIHDANSPHRRPQYPLLSLLFDVYTTAFKRGKGTILQQLGKLIDPNFADFVNSQAGRTEVARCLLEWRDIMNPLYSFIDLHIEEYSKAKSAGEVIELLPKGVTEAISKEEYRLVNGLIALCNMLRGTNNLRIPLSSSVAAVRKWVSRDANYIVDSVDSTTKDEITYILNNLSYQEIYRRSGIFVDMSMYTQRMFSDASPPLEGREDKLRRLNQLLSDPDRPFPQRALNEYLFFFLPELGISFERAERENNFLWNEVLNNSEWFVSPRGDRFRVERDFQLRDVALDWIRFAVDREHPREHRVEVKIEEADTPLYFWLDTERNLLDGNRDHIVVDPRYRNIFLNLILKRLYTITSGILATDEQELVGQTGGARSMVYRRAHYRHLNSTSQRPITMESYGAEMHAREIMEIYGIDIFAEIRRRRSLGTIRPNEYLTFVRESTPGIAGRLVLPNELSYYPELVEIPAV